MLDYELLKFYRVVRRRNGYSIHFSVPNQNIFKFVSPDRFDDKELVLIDRAGLLWYRDKEGRVIRRYLKSRERYKKTGTRKRGRPRKRTGL